MLSQMTVLECVQIEWEKHNYLPFIERYKLVNRFVILSGVSEWISGTQNYSGLWLVPL